MKKNVFSYIKFFLLLILAIGLFVAFKFDSIVSNATNTSLDNTIKLEYTFESNVKGCAKGSINISSTNSSSKGDYDIYWANSTGILDTYEKITTLKVNGTEASSYKFLSLNAIPDGVTKVVAVQNNTIKAEYTIANDKLLSGSKKYSFGALSDIHLDGDGDDEAKSQEDFKKELEYFKSQNVALLANSGDITRDGRDGDVNTVVEKIKSASFPVYTAAGNHDNNDPCRSRWSEIEPNGKIFEKTVNNDVFVFLGMNKYDFKDTFSSEQISQLTSILEKNKDKHVFLFEHVFFGSTGNVNGLYPYEGLSDSGTAGQFKELMKKYKNVISFTGHTHLEFGLQRAGEDANVKEIGDYGYRVHIPSASRPRSNDSAKKSSDTYNNYDGALGYLIDVYDNYVVLKGRDFSTGKNLPYATYILYTGEAATSGTSSNTTQTENTTVDTNTTNNNTTNSTQTKSTTVDNNNKTTQSEQVSQNTSSSTTCQSSSNNTCSTTQDCSTTNTCSDTQNCSTDNTCSSTETCSSDTTCQTSLSTCDNGQATVIEDAPATGDESLLTIYLVGACISVFIMLIILCIKLKVKK